MRSLNQTWNNFQSSINSLTTQAMQTFTNIGTGLSNFGQSTLSNISTFGSALGMGMGYGLGEMGSGLSNFSQSVWQETKIWGNALGLGMGYGLGQIGLGLSQTWNKIGPDPGFIGRFQEQFYRDRLPVISWFSPLPLPFPKGAIITGGLKAGEIGLRHLAIREATRNFSSFSGTRDFVYISVKILLKA